MVANLWISAVVLSLLSMLLTTARAAPAAFVVAVGTVTLLWALNRFFTRPAQRVRLLAGLVVALGVGVMAVVVMPGLVGVAVRSADLDDCGGRVAAERRSAQLEERSVSSLLEAGLRARRGSFTDRFEVYSASIESWTRRPVFGWAAQRYSYNRYPDLLFPLGSHSMYLGALYQRGILGLAALLALIGYAFWRLVRGFRDAEDARLKLFLSCLTVSFLAAGLAGFLDIFDIDVIVQVLYWTLLGLIIGATSPPQDRGEEE